jgi:hypothetical protein
MPSNQMFGGNEVVNLGPSLRCGCIGMTGVAQNP